MHILGKRLLSASNPYSTTQQSLWPSAQLWIIYSATPPLPTGLQMADQKAQTWRSGKQDSSGIWKGRATAGSNAPGLQSWVRDITGTSTLGFLKSLKGSDATSSEMRGVDQGLSLGILIIANNGSKHFYVVLKSYKLQSLFISSTYLGHIWPHPIQQL